MRAFALAALAGVIALPLGAQTQGRTDTLRLTLEDAVARALAQGQEMRIARAAVQDADGQVREAVADGLPKLTGTIVYTRQFASIYQNLGSGPDTGFAGALTNLFKNSPFGAANTWNAQLQATQLIFDGGKFLAGLNGARAYHHAASEQAAQTAADVSLNVKTAYLNAVYAAALVAVAEDNLTQARDQLHQVALFHAAGTRSDYDLLQARVDAANQEPDVIQARSGLDVALLTLKRLANVPADQPLALATPLSPTEGAVPVVADSGAGTADPPQLEAAEAGVSVQEAAVKVAQGDRWPTLTVGSTFSEEAFPQQFSPVGANYLRNWNAEIRVSIPIFQGFKTVGSIMRARAGLEQARAQRDQVRAQTSLDLVQARGDVDRTFSLLSARRQTVTEADRALHLATVRYGNGLSTRLEVSDARLARRQAEVNAVSATRDYLVALARLEHAVGRPLTLIQRSVNDSTPPTPAEGMQP
ncbi:MAG TPA: TolC family protein [Gemmatimonadales bacterium]|nr:TolC family protein [Gemmatimonadales bacterium]